MGDAESALPPSKKRGAGIQLTKDNPEADDDASEVETGTFKRASDEVLATRKIVKVRRTQPTSVPSSNPFAAIRLAPPSASGAKATSSFVKLDAVDKTGPKERDSTNEKIGRCEGTGSGTVVDGTNGTENSNRKLGDTTGAVSEVNDRVNNDAVEAVTKQVEVEKEAENGQEKSDVQDGREETKGEKEEIEAIGAVEKAVLEKTEGAIGASEKVVGEEIEKKTLENDKNDAAKPLAPVSSFQQLSSSQNAFIGIAGTGFGSSSFSFGPIVKEGPAFGSSSGSIFGFKSETQSFPSFGSGSASNGSFSFHLSGTSAHATKSGAKSLPSMQEVPVETGEENERAIFTADAVLYEYLDGGWKERGKGELKVNTQISDAQKARLVMRARGNYRLILNASIYPEMNLTNMDKKGVTFACINSAGDSVGELATFALKFKDSSFVEEFRGVVTAHKGLKDNVLKTPENSPKASDS
ncbi:nuclear pore complex protein NUP50B-like [Iris pallida]|uniref:Nuclear pore complex protein NUP50B-like n=1 Tax=Iris pallida TaxID=29817 RepID=A0AAX6GYY7_IRIPA|nr:nuclear pore complex protein NUP50B-like [Iris pallida]